jgi:hypothetical protein
LVGLPRRLLNVSTDAVSENVQALENALGVWLLNRITQRVEGVAAGVPGAICTFSPFSRFTGGCKITWSPSLTPALTSTSVP